MPNEGQSVASLELVKAPFEHRADYLESVEMPIAVRNRTGTTVLLQEIQLAFSTEEGVEPTLGIVSHQCKERTIPPDGLEPECIRTRPSLFLRPHTNVCTISVNYCQETTTGFGPATTAVLGTTEYLIIRDAPNFEVSNGKGASAVVSFKDDEDLRLAETAETILRRAGVRPYLARRDTRTGSYYWRKIEGEIRNAQGTLIIWTPNTEVHPKPVLRELRYSRTLKTPVGLFLEEGTKPPPRYSPKRREYTAFRREEPWAPFAQAIEAAALRLRQGKNFF